VGFFEKLFGGKKKERRKPIPREKREPLVEERAPDATAFAPESYPFEAEVRVYHRDYKRLTTGWWPVSVATPEEWQAKIEDMQGALRQHFGQFQTQDGRLVPRWSDRTWQLVKKRLRVGRK
jgi:hypothetical protein